jgi:hypothetical protein
MVTMLVTPGAAFAQLSFSLATEDSQLYKANAAQYEVIRRGSTTLFVEKSPSLTIPAEEIKAAIVKSRPTVLHTTPPSRCFRPVLAGLRTSRPNVLAALSKSGSETPASVYRALSHRFATELFKGVSLASHPSRPGPFSPRSETR